MWKGAVRLSGDGCEQHRDGGCGVGRRPSYYEWRVAEALKRAGTSRGAETPGTELREQGVRRDGAGGVRGRG